MISAELFTPQNTSSTQGRFYLKKKSVKEKKEKKEEQTKEKEEGEMEGR